MNLEEIARMKKQHELKKAVKESLMEEKSNIQQLN